MRLLIISGQGNILQSAAALATAGQAAATGLRVLLASTGPTHLLGQLMGEELGARPRLLTPNLAAMEIVALDEMADRWGTLGQNLRGGFTGRLREIGGDELPNFPGLDEVGALLVADHAKRSGRFDIVVLDGPPFDYLVRALALPDVLRWLVRLIFGLDRGAGRSRSSQEAALLPTTIIPPNLIAPLQDARVALERQRDWLDAATGTRVRLVIPAEELMFPPVRQAMRGLGLYGMEVDMVLARGTESMVDEATRAAFASLALYDPLPLTPTDLAGWTERGAQLYGQRAAGLDLPPNTREFVAPASETEPRELRLHIPFLEPGALDIAVANEEVVVRIGQFRRHLLLPALVKGGKLRAKVEGEILRLWVE